MKNSISSSSPEYNPCRSGYYISLVTVILTIVTFGIGIGTPPFSGPFCQEGCFEYPYLDIAGRFPRDYIWMYFAIFMVLSYLWMIIHVQHVAEQEKKLFGMTGLVFAIMSTLTFVTDYFLQISVIQPSLIAGESDGISLLTQFNAHGVFIVLEEIGFVFMQLSFFSLIPVFSNKSSLERALRWTFLVGFILMILSFMLITLKYGIQREYIFEVAVISITWIEMIIAGILLARYFKKEWKRFN